MTHNLKKNLLIVTAFLLFSASVSYGQKYCFVNSEYILSKITAYNDAQKVLDQLSVKWQKEIEEHYSNIDKLYKAFQAEQ
ncbi:MAG: OmpH family outer membrane protein, partial [Bacteroidia bacterium]|nr:OmpH family outer membrane protein [Bacteroidia bacterium]